MNTNAKWSRPTMKHIDPKTDKIVFQQIDTDFYEGKDKNRTIFLLIDN